MQILTDRLVLAPLRHGDAAELFAARGDPEVMAFWDWPADQNAAATARVVTAMLEEVAGGTARYFSIRRREGNDFVGLCDLAEIEPAGSAEIGFMLLRAHWHKGFAREAVAALIAQARATGFMRLSARIHAGNVRSACLLLFLGFAGTAQAESREVRPGVVRECRFFNLDLAP